MTELFPETPREHYSRAPLLLVICQVRFPTLLSISGSPPVKFQERIRHLYPMVKVESGFPSDIPPEFAKLLNAAVGEKSYIFQTEDEVYTLGLQSDSLSLTSTNYLTWELFSKHLEVGMSALVDIYGPSFYTRVGLRYQDAIDRESLGLAGVPWSALLRNELLAELSLPEFESNLDGVLSRTIRLRNPYAPGSITLKHGLAQVVGRDAPCYMIDIDFFSEAKTEVADAPTLISHYNRLAGRAFRWCIKEQLRLALDPEPLDPRND